MNAARSVSFLDLGAMHAEARAALDHAWDDVIATSAFIGGPHLDRFEAEWAAYCGTRHCVGVANGTDALTLILAALDVGPGDEVVVPANTFIATAMAVTAVGATPMFVDVDAASQLLTADIVAAALTSRTAAVMVVHLYGQMADVDAIDAVTSAAGVALIEDAAQAHGATWRSRRAGTTGVAAGYSFYPGKNLGALGDGGAVVTNDDALAKRVRLLANHGRSPENRHAHITDGRNSRLDNLQAAVLSAKLPLLDGWNGERRRVAAAYRAALRSAPLDLIAIHPEAESVHHVEPVFCDDRDEVAARLATAGVATGLHYPIPCHRQAPFTRFAKEPLPVCERAAARVLSLPMHPHLSDKEVAYVCAQLVLALGRSLAEHG
jgi:dTDP-4-amino-4,6-dideoxygalactose transaminase